MTTVVIDPGHGGTLATGGSSANHTTGPTGLREKDATLALARALRTELEAGNVSDYCPALGLSSQQRLYISWPAARS